VGMLANNQKTSDQKTEDDPHLGIR